MFEIFGREIGFSWIVFLIWFLKDRGNFGNVDGFDVKFCICFVINIYNFSIIKFDIKLN